MGVPRARPPRLQEGRGTCDQTPQNPARLHVEFRQGLLGEGTLTTALLCSGHPKSLQSSFQWGRCPKDKLAPTHLPPAVHPFQLHSSLGLGWLTPEVTLDRMPTVFLGAHCSNAGWPGDLQPLGPRRRSASAEA